MVDLSDRRHFGVTGLEKSMGPSLPFLTNGLNSRADWSALDGIQSIRKTTLNLKLKRDGFLQIILP